MKKKKCTVVGERERETERCMKEENYNGDLEIRGRGQSALRTKGRKSS